MLGCDINIIFDIKKCNGHVKWCNCGGNNVAVFYGCPRFTRAELVWKVGDGNEILYAEALRRIEGANNSSLAAGTAIIVCDSS